MIGTPEGRPRTPRRRSVVSWCLYDFANSAFTTLIVTFIYASFFTKTFVDDPAHGQSLWSRAVTVAGLAVAVLSPFAGAVADRGGYRRRFLLLATVVCLLATTGLFFVLPGQVTLALAMFAVANIAFEMAGVFYNAFLPDIAPPDRVGRISGYGWALGYLGGILALLLCLFAFIKPEVPLFGLGKGAPLYENVRASALVVVFWYAVFALPMLLFVREDRSQASPQGSSVWRGAWGQLVGTFREVGRYRQVVRFLLARLVFNDGLVTVFAFGGIYYLGTFGSAYTPEQGIERLIYFGILLNVTAALGAFVFGFVDDKLGGKRTILITIVALVLTTAAALSTRQETVFWICGALLGIFVGPNQAASRSLLARFVPPDKENEFFGFFAFSGKATAFLGPLLMGVVTEVTHSQAWGLSVVVVFFVVGGVILLTVDERAGIEAAREGAAE